MGAPDAETVENFEAIWPWSMKLPKYRNRRSQHATPGPLGALAMKRGVMSWVLLLLAASAIVLPASSRSEGGLKDVEPGDADYPLESANPTKIVQFTSVMPSWLHVHFNVIYMPAVNPSRKADEPPCRYTSRDGVAASYSVSVPLMLSFDQDRGIQGKSYRGSISVDRFKPGRCHWELVEVRYSIDENDSEDFVLFHYDLTSESHSNDSIDLWCTRVPTDYLMPQPPSRLHAVACQNKYLEKRLLLKRAAVVGSGNWGWNIDALVRGSSITAFFRDPEVPIPSPPNIVP